VANLTLSKLSPRAQLLVFVLLAVAGAAVYYYSYELPRQEVIATKTSELAAIRARIDKAAATARQLGEFQAQVADLEVRLESLKPILPQEKDVADLLRRIQTLATQSSLTIRGFKPEAITTRELHAEWPIGLELEGTYHNLGLFLDRVSRFPRIINIGSIAITAKQQPTPNATIDVTCTATTFVLLESPAAKPAPSPATRASE